MLALTGCLVDSDTSHLQKSYPYIDHFFKAGEQPPWLEKTDTTIVAPPPHAQRLRDHQPGVR